MNQDLCEQRGQRQVLARNHQHTGNKLRRGEVPEVVLNNLYKHRHSTTAKEIRSGSANGSTAPIGSSTSLEGGRFC